MTMPRDWGGLRGILDEARQLNEQADREVACPRCGTPLDFNAMGLGNCPLGHYRQSVPGQTSGNGSR